MNTLALLAMLPTVNTMLGWLIWIAIAAIVVWAVVALVKWSGLPVPQPVWIILAAFIGIALILIIAKMFNLLL